MGTNRNISDVIGMIRDNGPSENADTLSGSIASESENVAEPAVDRPIMRHATLFLRNKRKLLWASMIVILSAGVPLGLAGANKVFSGSGQHTGSSSHSSGHSQRHHSQVIIPYQVESHEYVSSRELLARQLEISHELDELHAVVASLVQESEKRWKHRDNTIERFRSEYNLRLKELSSSLEALKEQAASLQQTEKLSALTSGIASQEAATEKGMWPVSEEWAVNLATVSNASAADKTMASLLEQGISTERETLSVNGSDVVRLRVTGFASTSDAQAFVDELRSRARPIEGWISKI